MGEELLLGLLWLPDGGGGGGFALLGEIPSRGDTEDIGTTVDGCLVLTSKGVGCLLVLFSARGVILLVSTCACDRAASGGLEAWSFLSRSFRRALASRDSCRSVM